MDLLETKKEYKHTDKEEICKTNEQFEAMIQKLEAEVRNHIRIEHQLKIHLDEITNKTDDQDCEKFAEETENLRNDLKSKESEINKLRTQIGTSSKLKFDDMQQEVELLEEKVKELTDELEAQKIIEKAQ